jgi:hypothetical protein
MNLKSNKKQTKKITKSTFGDAVTDTVGNYEKHPFFIKKAALAKSYLSKTGLPKQLSSKV